MTRNVGTVDMVIRILIGAVLLYIGFFDNPIVSAGLSKNIIKIIALAPFLSGLFRSCPLYLMIGLDTTAKTE